LLAAWIEARCDNWTAILLMRHPLTLDISKYESDRANLATLFHALLNRDDDVTELSLYFHWILKFAHDPFWIPYWVTCVETMEQVKRSIELADNSPQIAVAISRCHMRDLPRPPTAWGAALLVYWGRKYQGVIMSPQASNNIITLEFSHLDRLRYWFYLTGHMPDHAERVLVSCVKSLMETDTVDEKSLTVIRFCQEEAGLDYEAIPFRVLVKWMMMLPRAAFNVWFATLLDMPDPWTPNVAKLVQVCNIVIASQ
jgi:hypothetical protein